jgi:energy-coupling factor transport system permease protein
VFIISVIGVVFGLARIPFRYAFGSVIRLRLFFLVILIMHIFFFVGETTIWAWGFFNMSVEGLQQGITVVANVILIIVLSNILTCTTAPMDTTFAIASLLKPLSLIKVPVEDVAMIINVAIQFIPTLLEEMDMVKKAQTARGARFESKKIRERAVSYLPLIVPIFLIAFQRADELATAMVARGYRNARGRTKKKRKTLRLSDAAALAGCAIVCFMQIYVFG